MYIYTEYEMAIPGKAQEERASVTTRSTNAAAGFQQMSMLTSFHSRLQQTGLNKLQQGPQRPQSPWGSENQGSISALPNLQQTQNQRTYSSAQNPQQLSWGAQNKGPANSPSNFQQNSWGTQSQGSQTVPRSQQPDWGKQKNQGLPITPPNLQARSTPNMRNQREKPKVPAAAPANWNQQSSNSGNLEQAIDQIFFNRPANDPQQTNFNQDLFGPSLPDQQQGDEPMRHRDLMKYISTPATKIFWFDMEPIGEWFSGNKYVPTCSIKGRNINSECCGSKSQEEHFEFYDTGIRHDYNVLKEFILKVRGKNVTIMGDSIQKNLFMAMAELVNLGK